MLKGVPVDGTGVVPHAFEAFGARNVIVFLFGIAGEVSLLLEDFGIEGDVFGNSVGAAHVVGSGGEGVHAGDPGAAGGGADGGVGIGVHVLKSFACELVEVGGLAVGVAVAGEPFCAVIFGGDPEYIGGRAGGERAGKKEGGEECEREEMDGCFHGNPFLIQLRVVAGYGFERNRVS